MYTNHKNVNSEILSKTGWIICCPRIRKNVKLMVREICREYQQPWGYLQQWRLLLVSLSLLEIVRGYCEFLEGAKKSYIHKKQRPHLNAEYFNSCLLFGLSSVTMSFPVDTELPDTTQYLHMCNLGI